MLLTHGARSVVWHAKAAVHLTPLQQWAADTERQRRRAEAIAQRLAEPAARPSAVP